MHRKIVHSLLSLLLVAATFSAAYRVPIVNAATQAAVSPQTTPGIEGN